MAHELTMNERRFFQENGYLILRGAVEKQLMDRVKSQLWEAVDDPHDDLEAWAKRDNIRLDRPEEHKNGAMLELSQHANTWGICEQLVGRETINDPSGVDVLITCPRPAADWDMPGHGHLDGFNVKGEYHAFTVGFTAYGLPVGHKGGAFTYWPGSHHKAWEHFQKNDYLDAEGIDSFTGRPGLGADLGPGDEFVGKPGDILFWHNLLTHTGSGNIGTAPRFGLIARFTRHDIAGVIEDRKADLWDYWGGIPT